LSHRLIASAAGVCRGTVAAIAAGRGPNGQPHGSGNGEEFQDPAGPFERCPGCGGMVNMPCRLCLARSLLQSGGAVLPPPDDAADPLHLDLKEDHRRRYEQVCARRQAEKENP
jgi:hypothetical protein